MTLGNLVLLLCDITANLNHFHTVEQRTGDSRQVIRSGNEQHLRQVVVHVEVVVVEGVVLFRVEYLEQGRSGIAIMCHLRHLVDFIENKHGIA